MKRMERIVLVFFGVLFGLGSSVVRGDEKNKTASEEMLVIYGKTTPGVILRLAQTTGGESNLRVSVKEIVVGAGGEYKIPLISKGAYALTPYCKDGSTFMPPMYMIVLKEEEAIIGHQRQVNFNAKESALATC